VARVLVVDDSQLSADTIATVLSRANHVVACVRCSADALDAAATWAPDVVLLDRRLPDADGLDIVPALRRPDGTPRIVIMSGDPLPAAARPLVDDFVLKPAGARELLAAIEN
jgi:DNA-binding response OmpR family regulator